ncbi:MULTISPECIES: glycoside hydrolase family 25 protein [Corynebacterium]|uniref:Lysozyme M1 n=1 Tax=Corynebacterium provencense TaxID=1737425 RepID=A0A2Z3YPB8_9CORY|nr:MULTISPECIES: glycoside hydrolase family 25 protein [Corynebacterium]AWT27325.1 Lysozyme M1 [Corynebacterium provencense]MCI1256946.1 glycoside hydrolase family 25 protein [Corynebacterium provencense]
MRSLPWRRHARTTTPARLTATVLMGSAAAVAALVATDVLPVPSWALDGIDVASHQHPGGAAIDWDAVAASGQSFAFIKATEGTGYTNPYFSSDSAKAAAAGITPGSYHYAKPEIDARTQARYYAAQLATGVSPSLPPTLDLEETGGLGPTELQNWVREWIDEIKTLTGRDPIIYTYYSFWVGQMGNTTEFSEYPLWLAYYNSSLPDQIPGGWDEVTFWQYSGSGSVDGVITDVDLNTYYGTDEELQALTGTAESGTTVGDATEALKPIQDAAVDEAETTNAVQHSAAVLGLPVLNIPLSTDLLVNLLGLVAGEVSPEVVLQTALNSGFDYQTSQTITDAGTETRDADITLPQGRISELVSTVLGDGNGTVTLQGVLRVLNEFGAQDYITNLAGHVNGSAYSPAG